jgi:REP element-mobilizing transposase RayT
MPRRPPIDPEGLYHVGSRGCYGRTLFHTREEHETFLTLYFKAARKYGWTTLSWALMKNHHHFVIRLTDGGLSEGFREIHTSYSRRIHAKYDQTRKGHLFRHAFFANPLEDEEAVLSASSYVDQNPSAHRRTATPRRTDWCSYAATLGLTAPHPFHNPSALLDLVHPRLDQARKSYQLRVEEDHARRRLKASPNNGVGTVTAARG